MPTTPTNFWLSALVATVLTTFSVATTDAAPIAQYSFNNADIIGTAAQADKAGSNNTSEPLGAVSTGSSGKFEQAYSFAGGANNLMTIPAGIVPSGAAARTLSIWFKQTADQASLQDKLFGYGAGSSGNAFDVSLEDGRIRLRHFGGSVAWGSGFDFDGTDAGWHHLAVRVNAGASTFADVDVFLDGAPDPVFHLKRVLGRSRHSGHALMGGQQLRHTGHSTR